MVVSYYPAHISMASSRLEVSGDKLLPRVLLKRTGVSGGELLPSVFHPSPLVYGSELLPRAPTASY